MAKHQATSTSNGGAPGWRRAPSSRTGADILRWALLACWVFLLTFAMADGARPTSLGQLESALASGEVHTVAVTPGLLPGESGSTTQELYWRQGLFRYYAEAQTTTPDAGDQSTQPSGVTVRTGSDIAAELTQYNGQVKITHIPYPQSGTEIHGWRLPSWLGWVGLVATVGTLALLVSDPQPWRATRWAWFWLMTTPIGTILFLVLAGPTPPLLPPRNPARRLTGGWAFLVVIVLAPFLPRW